MHDDEKALLLAIQVRCGRGKALVRDVIAEIGINHKRASYLLLKWTRKGWYDYGVCLDLGWLEPQGLAVAVKLAAPLVVRTDEERRVTGYVGLRYKDTD